MQAGAWFLVAAGAVAAEAFRRRSTEYIEVTQTDISPPFWPLALDGLRLLVVSDMHVHPYATSPGRREAKVMDLISGLDCDLLLCPGDCANTLSAARVAAQTLRAARPRYGTFITPGNGEHKRRWNQTNDVLGALQTAGSLLLNDNVRVMVRGEPLYVLGVDDPSHDRDRLDRAARGVPPDATKVLVAHSPDIVTRLHRVPVDLVVCGHTHGGQVCRPDGSAIWTQMSLSERDALGSGLYGPDDLARHNANDVARARMYVSRGVGTAKLAVRAFCRPEIAVLTVRAPAQGAGAAA